MGKEKLSDDALISIEKHKRKVLIVNFVYVVIILTLTIITILAICEKINNPVISNIATVTSIILSVLAIFITVVANNSSNNLLHSIRDIADNLSGLPERIGASIAKLDTSTDKLDKIDNLDKIDKLDELKKLDQLVSITEKLSSIEEGLNSYANSVSRIGEKVDGMQSAFLNSSSNTSSEAPLDGTLEEPTKEVVEAFLAKNSDMGILLIYGICKFKEGKKIFGMDTFSKAITDCCGSTTSGSVGIHDYLCGFFVCFKSIPGYMILKNKKFDINNLTIENVNKDILDNIDSIFDKRKTLNNKFKDAIDKLIKDSPSID